MADFRDGKVDLLVATLVVEVGIDVPNATLMVIEHAERFGLSQLHQLRGRVSRGTTPGECYLFTGSITDDAKERLRIFTRTSDGFAPRGSGRRSYAAWASSSALVNMVCGDLEIGDLLRDREILEAARADAWDLIIADPGFADRSTPLCGVRCWSRYGQTLDLAEIG